MTQYSLYKHIYEDIHRLRQKPDWEKQIEAYIKKVKINKCDGAAICCYLTAMSSNGFRDNELYEKFLQKAKDYLLTIYDEEYVDDILVGF